MTNVLWVPALLNHPGSIAEKPLVKPRSQKAAIEYLRDRRDRLESYPMKTMAILAYEGDEPTGERFVVTFDESGTHTLQPDRATLPTINR